MGTRPRLDGAAAHLRRPAPDWEEVLRLCARLLVVWDSPAVALTAAAAPGLARGPAAGLAAQDRLADDPVLPRSHDLPAARAERRHLERRRASLPS